MLNVCTKKQQKIFDILYLIFILTQRRLRLKLACLELLNYCLVRLHELKDWRKFNFSHKKTKCSIDMLTVHY